MTYHNNHNLEVTVSSNLLQFVAILLADRTDVSVCRRRL